MAKMMQEAGYVNCTPANIGDFDEYDIQGALIMREIENDPSYKKAQEYAEKARGKKKTGSGERVKVENHGHLQAVPDLVAPEDT